MRNQRRAVLIRYTTALLIYQTIVSVERLHIQVRGQVIWYPIISITSLGQVQGGKLDLVPRVVEIFR